jgi:hypothetical protein
MGSLSSHISARDVERGEKLGPTDFIFVEPEEVLRLDGLKARPQKGQLETAVMELETLLLSHTADESSYRRFLTKYPWSFGARYTDVTSHQSLDDENITDFSGVRSYDGARDILEIKGPFLQLFKTDGDFSADFNAPWNQTERYLDFTRREADYLRRQKGLRFENPHCYLVLGHNLDPRQVEKLLAKQRMNPAITILTYNDLLALVKHTADFVRSLHAKNATE